MLELKHIHKYYNAGTVNEMCLFNDFNLSIDDHQFVSVVGSNGSGKTSLLNIICGSIPLDDGRIIIGGEDITKMPEYKRQRRIGRVYQNPSMGTCPSMTIAAVSYTHLVKPLSSAICCTSSCRYFSTSGVNIFRLYFTDHTIW